MIQNDWVLAGQLTILWACADAVLNLVALVLPERFSYCLLSMIGRKLFGERQEQILLAVDTLLSFIIVSIMIGVGYITELPQNLVLGWNLAVIGNVVAVGLERIWFATKAEV